MEFNEFYDEKYQYSNNYLLRLTFYSGGAWADQLGVTSSNNPKIIYDYPCYLRGSMIPDLAYANVKCDLYFAEPNPYFEIYGLNTTNF